MQRYNIIGYKDDFTVFTSEYEQLFVRQNNKSSKFDY